MDVSVQLSLIPGLRWGTLYLQWGIKPDVENFKSYYALSLLYSEFLSSLYMQAMFLKEGLSNLGSLGSSLVV